MVRLSRAACTELPRLVDFFLSVIYKFSTPLTDTLTTQSAILTSSYWGSGATPESDMNKYRHIKIQQAYLQYVLLLFPGKRCFIQLDTGVRIYTMIFNRLLICIFFI